MRKIEKNYNENREETYRILVQNNIDERNNYMESFKKYLEKQKELSEIKREKAFKKYESFVSIIFIL